MGNDLKLQCVRALALLLGVAIVAGCQRTPTLERDGGVRLVYEVDFVGVNELDDVAADTADLPDMPSAIRRRMRRYPGTTAAPISETEFEIIVPRVDETESAAIKELISSGGTLRFQIIANTRDHADTIDLALASDEEFVVAEGEKVARWANVGLAPADADGKVDYRGIDATDVLRGRHDGDAYESIKLPDDALRNIVREDVTLADAIAQLGFRDVQVLVILEPPGLNISGRHLQRATKGYDSSMNPAIDFTMKPDGAKLLERLTSDNLPSQDFYRRMGILLDNELMSAPRLMSVIAENGQITGKFTEREVDDIVAILRVGRLPVVLKRQPVSEEWIEPGAN